MSHVAGLGRDESRWVLDFVGAHVTDVAFQCRWRWSEGDLAIWDERSTLHRSAADHWPHRRVIRRLEIDGDRPFFDPTADHPPGFGRRAARMAADVDR